MPEPLSLTVLSAAALTEGIRFLYAQTGEVLQRWRDRNAAHAQSDAPRAVDPSVLEGELVPAKLDYEMVERLEAELTALAGRLGNYANGLQEVDKQDEELLAAVDALRRGLELVHGQRITFRGEDRPPSGPLVVGRADVDDVIGEVAGVRARIVRGQTLGEVTAREVRGRASGVEVDTI